MLLAQSGGAAPDGDNSVFLGFGQGGPGVSGMHLSEDGRLIVFCNSTANLVGVMSGNIGGPFRSLYRLQDPLPNPIEGSNALAVTIEEFGPSGYALLRAGLAGGEIGWWRLHPDSGALERVASSTEGFFMTSALGAAADDVLGVSITANGLIAFSGGLNGTGVVRLFVGQGAFSGPIRELGQGHGVPVAAVGLGPAVLPWVFFTKGVGSSEVLTINGSNTVAQNGQPGPIGDACQSPDPEYRWSSVPLHVVTGDAAFTPVFAFAGSYDGPGFTGRRGVWWGTVGDNDPCDFHLLVEEGLAGFTPIEDPLPVEVGANGNILVSLRRSDTGDLVFASFHGSSLANWIEVEDPRVGGGSFVVHGSYGNGGVVWTRTAPAGDVELFVNTTRVLGSGDSIDLGQVSGVLASGGLAYTVSNVTSNGNFLVVLRFADAGNPSIPTHSALFCVAGNAIPGRT